MDRLEGYHKKQLDNIHQAYERINRVVRLKRNKRRLEDVSPEQYRIDFVNPQIGLVDRLSGEHCADPVYRKLGRAFNYTYLASVTPKRQRAIESKLHDFRIALERRRGISEEEYNHILETPIVELVKELSDKVEEEDKGE